VRIVISELEWSSCYSTRCCVVLCCRTAFFPNICHDTEFPDCNLHWNKG